MISIKEKKKRQHEKELKSFRNKMGSNIIWFDSLPLGKQYDLLFSWKREKFNNKHEKPVKKYLKYIRQYYTEYPVNFKYFLKPYKNNRHFQPSVINLRNTTIDLILNIK